MKADATLTRFDQGDQGTFGKLTAPGFASFTGELPWRDNAPGRSCIPAGAYRVIWAWSPHLHKFTYRLVGVDGRSGILLHSANLMGDREKGYKAQLLGCISPGRRLGWMDRQKAVLLSAPAVSEFEAVMRRQPFNLEIIDGHS